MKSVAVCLCIVLLLQISSPSWGMTKEQWERVKVEKIKKQVLNISRKDPHVVLRLKNKQKLQGYVRNIEKDEFTLCNAEGNVIVAFRDVSKIQKVGLSTSTKVWLATVIGIGTFLALVKLLVPYT